MKTVLPHRIRRALWLFSLTARRRGRPFSFTVHKPQSERTLRCCIAYNKYGAYCVPLSGLRRPAARYVLANKVWEAETIDLIVPLCRHGDVVHAGTFFGDFLPALADACAAVGNRVWAFEPNPESYHCAAITLQLNQIGNVELINAGLGEQVDNRYLAIAEKGTALGGASHMLADLELAQKPEDVRVTSVPIVTIDDSVPPDRLISVIHLDVEGYEERALTGALKTIRRHRPLLILETLPGQAWLTENLAPLGYRVAESFLENTVLRPDSAANTLAMPSSRRSKI